MVDIPLPFGEWLPDLGENENPGLVEAKNVVPEPGGYRPIGAMAQVATTMQLGTASAFPAAQGFRTSTGHWILMSDGSATTYALQLNGSSAPTVKSQAGVSTYFVQYDDVIYGFLRPAVAATSIVKFNATTETFSSPSVSMRGVSAAQIGRFIVRAQPTTTGLFDFAWSAFNNPEDVTFSQTTQAGQATVNNADLGPVVGITGGRIPMIFQTRGVSRLTYVGPPLVWRTDEISNEYGALTERSFQRVGDRVYFLSSAGVCVTDGASVIRLGDGRVDEYIQGFIPNASQASIRSAHVESDGAIYWLLQGGSGQEDPVLGYSYRTNRFFRVSTGDTEIRSIAETSLDQSIAGNANGQPTLRRNTRLFLSTNTITAAALSGDNMAAEVTTGYTALTPGRRIAINNVEPVYDGSGAKVAVNTKATQAGAVAAGTPVAVNSDGIADLRADGRLAAVSVTFDAGAEWSELKGAVVTGDVSGAR